MKTILLTAAFVISASFSAWGDVIPYPDPGSVAATDTFTATSTGDVIGYFYGHSAADTDVVQMCDVTTMAPCSPFAFNNQSTLPGTSNNFGPVNAGDIVIFNLVNVSTGQKFSSDPAHSVDGINHAYGTAYTGVGAPPVDASIPPGTFVGMEDLSLAVSDLDYNDDQFVFTNIATSMTPEPSLVFLCAGLLGVLLVVRHRFAS